MSSEKVIGALRGDSNSNKTLRRSCSASLVPTFQEHPQFSFALLQKSCEECKNVLSHFEIPELEGLKRDIIILKKFIIQVEEIMIAQQVKNPGTTQATSLVNFKSDFLKNTNTYSIPENPKGDSSNVWREVGRPSHRWKKRLHVPTPIDPLKREEIGIPEKREVPVSLQINLEEEEEDLQGTIGTTLEGQLDLTRRRIRARSPLCRKNEFAPWRMALDPLPRSYPKIDANFRTFPTNKKEKRKLSRSLGSSDRNREEKTKLGHLIDPISDHSENDAKESKRRSIGSGKKREHNKSNSLLNIYQPNKDQSKALYLKKLNESRTEPTIIPNEQQHRIQRLENRNEKLQIELTFLHRIYSRYRDFRNRIEPDLVRIGVGCVAMSVIAHKQGVLSTKSTLFSKMWKKRKVQVTETMFYVWRLNQGNDVPTIVIQMHLSELIVSDKEEKIFSVSSALSGNENPLDFLAESEQEKNDWLKDLEILSLQARDPLSKFKITDKESLLQKLCSSEYRLACSIVEHTSGFKNSEDVIQLIIEGLESINFEGLRFVTFCLEEDLERTKSLRNLWRQNSTETKVAAVYCKHRFQNYLISTLREPLEKIVQKNFDMEIFAEKLTDKSQLQQNYRNIETAFQLVFDSVIASKNQLPWQLRVILHNIYKSASKKFPQIRPLWVSGGFFFLRFLCPAIVVPEKTGLLNNPPPSHIQRGLLFITKILQNMANNMEFGSKEREMELFNNIIQKNMSSLVHFLAETSLPPVVPKVKAKPMSDDSYAHLKQEVIDILDKIEPVLYTTI